MRYLLNLLKNRRTVRKFDPKKIEKEKLDYILKCALLSPSSHSVTPWNFIVVDDKELLEKLSHSKLHGSQFMNNCAAAIIITADTSKTDVWTEDCAIASTIIQLAGESQGLSSCWIQIRKRMHSDNTTSEQYIKNIFKLSENIAIESIIALGYKAQETTPHNEKDLKYNQVTYNNTTENFF